MHNLRRCMVCLDMGTTRTRAWFMQSGKVMAKIAEDFGVRDLAAGRNIEVIKALKQLLENVQQAARERHVHETPECIMAAGMIGSPQGLHHVPHVSAPAGLHQLASGIATISLHEITHLPVHIVPGVRVHGRGSAIDRICSSDVIRGEESLVMGLLCSQRMQPNDWLLNLGSHWKWIGLDDEGCIATSRTSLTGEMIHSVQTNTLLASGLPQQRPNSLDQHLLAEGARQAKCEGLSRALFCVRLLELSGETTAEQRISFLYGAFLQQEISAIQTSSFFTSSKQGRVLISGPNTLAECWRSQLNALGREVDVLTEENVEYTYLAGLSQLLMNENSGDSEMTAQIDRNYAERVSVKG
jgi:2-dehydro-3-deoxygalactonokinase